MSKQMAASLIAIGASTAVLCGLLAMKELNGKHHIIGVQTVKLRSACDLPGWDRGQLKKDWYESGGEN